jgi:hypothetical protein
MFEPKLKMRTKVARLEAVVEAWRRSMRHHTFEAGLDNDEIEAVEYELGLKFPGAFRALYEMSDGLSLCHGNVTFAPMDMGDGVLSIRNFSRKLRSWKWEIPKEVVVFGGDGSDGTYGLWLPEGTPRKPDCAVVEIGEAKGLALRATNLCSFLTWKTAYFLLLDGEIKALDAVELPGDLRVDDGDQYARLIRWADPEVPDPLADPYKCPVTVEEMRARFGA